MGKEPTKNGLWKIKLYLFSLLPRSECGIVFLIFSCQNSFEDETVFTGTVSLIDLDAGLRSRFLSPHAEQLGDISDVVVLAPGQSNHGLSDPRPPWPFASCLSPHRMHFTNVVQCPGPQRYCSSASDPCTALSCHLKGVYAATVVQQGITWVALCQWRLSLSCFSVGSTVCRRMHLAQGSWWGFYLPCRKERDFEDTTYCSSRMCWSTLQ